MVRAFQELGFETKTGDTGDLPADRAPHARRSDTGSFEGEFTEEMTDELFEAIREDPVVRVPSDFVLVGRVFSFLSGIAHTLGHRGPTCSRRWARRRRGEGSFDRREPQCHAKRRVSSRLRRGRDPRLRSTRKH